MGVRLPGFPRSLSLAQPLSIPPGTRVDARRCGAKLFSGRHAALARAAGGAFVVKGVETRRNAAVLALAGSASSSCRAAPASRRARVLNVHAAGRVRLAARFSVSEGRDATWTVEDRCSSTVTHVRRGRVRVRDLGRRRAVVVGAPRRHVSRPPSTA
jgi:hypothetical protein